MGDADAALPDDAHLGWWSIHGGDLLNALKRVSDGEDPDLVYAEMYANCDDHTDYGQDDS